MKIVKLVLFIFSMLFIVFLANFLQFNKQRSEKNNTNALSFNTSNLITYEYGDVKSVSSIYFNTKQEVLAKLFNTSVSSMQNSILSNNIKIDGMDAQIILFTGEHRIEQITVLLEGQSMESISKTINEIKQKVSLNAPAEIEEIENSEGSRVAIITTYNASKYDFIITEYFNTTSLGFTIDLVNNIYGY